MTSGWKRIAGLDGLRAIAVLLVFLDHRLPGANPRFVGGYAVHIFFVLSGFLIVGMLHRDRLAIAHGRESAASAWRGFMRRRAARILPPYYLLLLILLLLSAWKLTPPIGGGEAASYGLFLSNLYFIATGHWGLFSQSWSLAIEEQFYLLAAPLLLLLPPGAAWRICLATTLGAFAWNLALCLTVPASMAPGLDSLSNFGLIALGGLFALQRRPSARTTALWVQPILLAALLLVPLIPDGASNPIVRQAGQPLLAALLIAEIRDHQDTMLVRLLEARPLLYLARISYGLYLVHQFVTAELLRRISGGLIDITGWTPLQQFLPLLLASIGVAACSWHLLERPIIAWARRAPRSKPVEPTVPAVATV